MRAELQTAIKAAKSAGDISLKYFGGRVPYTIKPDGTPVTKVDQLCENAILKILRRAFPKYSLLCEESGDIDNNSDRCWIVDPIDGTKAYMHGMPTYGNMIALEENRKIILGVVNLPALNRMIYAQKGFGAYENGRRMQVSTIGDIHKAFILHGRGKGFLEMGYLKKLRKLLDAVYHSWGFSEPYASYLVASGKAEAFVETFPRPWDVAAPKIIIEEAGGKFTDLDGRNTLRSKNIAIYSNGKLHNDLIRILRK